MLPYPYPPNFSLPSCHYSTSSPGICDSQETWNTKCSISCSRHLQLRANPFTALCIPSVQNFALQRGGNRSLLTHVPHGRQADNALFSLSFLPDYGVTFSQCCSSPWSLSEGFFSVYCFKVTCLSFIENIPYPLLNHILREIIHCNSVRSIYDIISNSRKISGLSETV